MPPALTIRLAVPPALAPVKKVAPPALVMIVAEPAVLPPRKAVTPPLLLTIVAVPAVALPTKAVAPTSLAMGTAAGLVRALIKRAMLKVAMVLPSLMMVAWPADADGLNWVMPPLLLVMKALPAVLEPTKAVPLKKAAPAVLTMVALPAVLLPRNPVTPPSMFTMTALPALAAFRKARPGVVETAPPLETRKAGTVEELLTMPAPTKVIPVV